MKAPVVPSLPYIGHSVQFQNNALKLTKKVQKKYGDVFQISLLNERVLTFLTPSSTKEIFLDKNNIFSSKRGWEFSLGKTFENGVMLRDFEDHKYHRSLLQESFRHDAIENYLYIIQDSIDDWLENLKTRKEIYLYSSIKQLMFDISLDLFFQNVNNEDSHLLNKMFSDSISSATSVVRSPLPFTKLKKGLKARKYLLNYFEKKAMEVVQKEKNTIFEELVLTNKEVSGLSNFEIAEHMIFLLLAAHDTTTITLTNSIYNLAKESFLVEELRNEAHNTDVLKIADLKNGLFAESIFKESIRLYPPVPFSLRCAVEETTVENYSVLKDQYIAVSPLLLHHDERYWSNPEKFDPKRFIDVEQNNESYFPFAGGAHTCLGKFLASYIFKNVVYKFVQTYPNFEIESELNIRPTPIPHPVKDVLLKIKN